MKIEKGNDWIVSVYWLRYIDFWNVASKSKTVITDKVYKTSKWLLSAQTACIWLFFRHLRYVVVLRNLGYSRGKSPSLPNFGTAVKVFRVLEFGASSHCYHWIDIWFWKGRVVFKMWTQNQVKFRSIINMKSQRH